MLHDFSPLKSLRLAVEDCIIAQNVSSPFLWCSSLQLNYIPVPLMSLFSHITCFIQPNVIGSDMRYFRGLFSLCQKIVSVPERGSYASLSHIMKTGRRARGILNDIWGHL